MTYKRFEYIAFDGFSDNGVYITPYQVVELLNELHEEKEYWKGSACNNSNFVNILLHELDIAQEKGYKVSDPFEKLMKREELIE